MATPSICLQNGPWKEKYVPDVENSKYFLNSAIVMFKPGLSSNNKITAISIVSFSGIY